ncbi:biotin/lipoate--protein ligase family protein [Shimia aestuarii]|uniref:Biotin-(Acetyl-CoA carboxylase) ligase n=1 Tax=Shimia aestuarii TaxID=254406 RepID=A0A1I4Q5Y0_9RHOB|nr:biotin/lipoate--protein ligase family protein [Shimia aestuarii]SFM35472.1 Biotin-(acetyl-CoA carboxylase) ligase [Shimia aestuarii]
MNRVMFPPLMSGHQVTGDEDPFLTACMKAAAGCDSGLIVYNLAPDTLLAALVFAPEVPLADAMTMLPVCAVGFQNALGALAPPEVAVHLEWGGGLRVNGASCGRMRAAASTSTPTEIPDWLVVGFELPLWPASADMGNTPDQTALYAEGCADVEAPLLIESWARHTLNWVNRWEEEGTKPLHAEWRGLAHGLGEETAQGDVVGVFVGVDEQFGMLLRDENTTHLFPLNTLLEDL